MLFISHLIRKRVPGAEKLSPYECGVDIFGPAWHRYNVRFYVFAVLFVIFDVEALFLFPWALLVKRLGIAGLFEAFIFVAVLFLGLAYAWRQGGLEWI